MNKRRTVLAAIAIVLVAAGAAWALGMFGGDAQIAELNQMREQMFANRDLPDEQRQQLREQFRQRIDGLSESQRRQFFESSRGQWMQHAQERMDEFFALPAAERQARLDQMIDRMLDRQRERAQNPNADNNRGPGRGGPGGWANLTDAQREQRAKQRLDHTTPQMRAQRDEFRRQLTERLQKRGIDPGSVRGGGFRGGGFRGGWGRPG